VGVNFVLRESYVAGTADGRYCWQLSLNKKFSGNKLITPFLLRTTVIRIMSEWVAVKQYFMPAFSA